jgi:flavin-dependent dehydrogenase
MRRGDLTEEIVVIGGGLAGASVACLLAQAGRQVLLIERSAEAHHKVCGEFLSVEAQRYLAHLGLDLDGLGATTISSVRIIRNRTVAEADLPFQGRGLSRRSLDEALLRAAALSGARLERGAPIRSIAPDGGNWRIDHDMDGPLRSRTLFLATGKHDVRGGKRSTAGTRDDLIGFKAHFVLTASQQSALDGAVEIALFAGGYVGLQMVEGGIANLCLLVSQRCFDEIGKRWDNLLDHICDQCPPMASRLDGAVAAFPRPLTIFRIPYGFVHAPQPSEPESLFRLGDQLAVIPSFTGDGMAIALHSGFMAASTYLRYGRGSSLFHRTIRNDLRSQIRMASLLDEAGRWPASQLALVRIFQAWPRAMQSVAGLTRLREAAIQRALVTP